MSSRAKSRDPWPMGPHSLSRDMDFQSPVNFLGLLFAKKWPYILNVRTYDSQAENRQLRQPSYSFVKAGKDERLMDEKNEMNVNNSQSGQTKRARSAHAARALRRNNPYRPAFDLAISKSARTAMPLKPTTLCTSVPSLVKNRRSGIPPTPKRAATAF